MSVYPNSGGPNFIDERLNISNELKGTYIHRRLINRFACWCSNEYSYKIEELLDDLFTRQIIELKKGNLEKDNKIFESNVRVNINNKNYAYLKLTTKNIK
jgi:hypothetical protein